MTSYTNMDFSSWARFLQPIIDIVVHVDGKYSIEWQVVGLFGRNRGHGPSYWASAYPIF